MSRHILYLLGLSPLPQRDNDTYARDWSDSWIFGSEYGTMISSVRAVADDCTATPYRPHWFSNSYICDTWFYSVWCRC